VSLNLSRERSLAQNSSSTLSAGFLATVPLALYPGILLALPLVGLTLSAIQARSDPRAFSFALGPVAIAAYQLTIAAAAFATILNVIFGFLLAWALVRYDFPGKAWVDAAIDLPFSLPTSVAGLTLLFSFSERGPRGARLESLGIHILFGPGAVALARAFVSFPFAVRSVQPVLLELEPELEEAALSLGASPWEVFQWVVWPAIRPALWTGGALGFARAVGEFGSVVRVSSNLALKDLVAPVLVFQALESYETASASLVGAIRLSLSLLRLIGINRLASTRR
jgi:sulfate/thiosulfate transport system permease protein